MLLKKESLGVGGGSRARPGSPPGFEVNSLAAVVVVTFHRNSRISAVRSAGSRGGRGAGLQRASGTAEGFGELLVTSGVCDTQEGDFAECQRIRRAERTS